MKTIKKLKILLNEIKIIFSQIISCKQAHAAGIHIKKVNYNECWIKQKIIKKNLCRRHEQFFLKSCIFF